MTSSDAERRNLESPTGRRVLTVLCIGVGLIVGAGMFTFGYAEGDSYLTDEPKACANCHIMNDHLQRWERSTHSAVAVCNDCHAPKSFFAKYGVKSINGFNHSLAFTTGKFKDPFEITDLNIRVAEENCRKCHMQIAHSVDFGQSTVRCTRCHEGVGH